MNNSRFWPALLLASLLLFPTDTRGECQSLFEAAQREAQRRKGLEQQSIEGKTIAGNGPSQAAPQGKISTSSPALSSRPAPGEPKPKARLQTFRSALQKYDWAIRRSSERLRVLQSRLGAESWTLPRVEGRSGRINTRSSRDNIKMQIQDLELELAQLRRERLETYDAGRKEGFLPGELDGRGIIP
jgi:hypothetical protein